jgi:lysyl-tRNA synthetase class 2
MVAKRHRIPRLAAAGALLVGVIDLLSVLLPAQRARLVALSAFVPGVVEAGASAATAAAGIGLILLAGGLRRRRRSAFVATVVLLLGSAVAHVIKSLDVEEALIEAFLGGLLLGKVDRFSARAGPGERGPVVRPAVALVLITYGYGLLGLVINRRSVTGSLSFHRALVEVTNMALGLGTALHLTGRFSRFFPASVFVLFIAGALIVLLRALAPVLSSRSRSPALAALVAASDDSLAYFALRDDRSTIGTPDGDAMVSYGAAGTVALAAGDPLGPREHWPAAVEAFLAEAADQGRVAAVIGCGADAAAVYERAGLRAVYLGDEAVLRLDRFSLEGRAVRIARQSWNRAKRAGYTAEVARSGELDAATVARLQAVSRHWRGEAAERGFSMALGRLFDPRDKDTLVVLARDGSGRIRGFFHFVPWGRDGASLDVMRRERDAPAILNDFLVVEAARRLPELGIRRMSLNFSFLRAVLAAGSQPGAPLGLRLERQVLLWLSKPFQIETLYRFNKKFNPSWQPRYAAVEAIEDLPRVAMAALRLEGLLSLPRLRRRAQAGEEPAPEEAPA